MDMDFLTDPIFSDLGRSDFIGGIDNEALDFGHLDQYMQVAATVGDIDNGSANNSNSASAKTESPTSNVGIANDTSLRITSVSARVSLASTTPIATPLLATVNQATTHLPESPPDSGSEPPYSPLQDTHTGLTLTSRDIYHGLPTIHQPLPAMHDLHMQPQFTPPHQHYSHNLQNNNLNAPLQAVNSTNEIRIKHEAGLLMNPTSLATPQQMLSSQHNLNDTHIEIPALPSLYPNLQANGLTNFESLPSSNLFAATAYNPINAVTGPEQAPTCLLTTSVSDAARVQVIGTSQATRTSAPSTPLSRTASSRKRKLSTQLDYVEYANIKPETMSPNGSSHCGTPHHHQHAADIHKLGPTSPVSITLPTHNNDVSSTPAHSSASLSPALSTVNSNPDNSMDGSNSNNAGDSADANSLTPCIRFNPFQTQNWHKLCDQSLQELAVVYYRVDADKGFNFSVSDDAFVCQKKNHFQITCHARLQGEAKFVKTPSGLEKIKAFHLHFYGVKLETPNQTIRVEQSQSDRSKKPFYPVPIDLQSHIVSKVTVGRLHFSETTNNNMRKKGRPNPEQRFFQLVVGLHVHTMSGNFPVISQASERIIVRASNPGQFESDVDLCWQRGITQDSIFHAGRVGINTDRPDESLVVHGNLKVSGHIVQPSDSRAKREIFELDTSVQLRNLQKIRIVRYRYEPEFAIHSGLKRGSASDSEEIVDTGVIAQEVREVIPDAVQEAGSIVLPNGNVIENFLLVNKDRILMENIGAVKELCKVTGSLENRIEHLERVNNRLIRAKEYEQKSIQGRFGRNGAKQDGYEICSNRALQLVIIFLVIVMATCLAAVSTLYFMEHNKKHPNYKQFDEMEALSNGLFNFGHDPVRVAEEKNYLFHHLFTKTTTRPPSAKNNTKPHQELIYNESAEVFQTHVRNDELTAVMEKPVVNIPALQALRHAFRMTTTAPLLRNNKTISSKNKSKWPLAQEVLRSATLQNPPVSTLNLAPSSTTATISADTVEKSNASETSSDKVAEAIPVPQDFENNSIDIDAQQVTKAPLAKQLAARLNIAGNRATAVVGNTDLTLKLTSPIVSTSSSNSIYIPDTTASANNLKLGGNGEQIIYNVYKTALPPTTIQQNHTVDTLTTSNKSQSVLESGVDNADALDLQNLSSNNDSVDNLNTALFGVDFNGGRESSLGRRSTMQRSLEPVTRRTVIRTFGAPAQCSKKSLRDDTGICQSVCFEDSNQLPPLAQHIEKPKIDEHQQQNVDSEEEIELEENQTNLKVPDSAAVETNATTKIATGKSSHATQAIAKQLSDEQQSEDTDEETILEHSNSEENLNININIETIKTDVDDTKNLAALAPSLSVEVHRPPALDCWKISSSIVADNLSNDTFGLDDICPKVGKSMNLTYVIPLSRFFKQTTIELHLSASTPLLWTICNNHEHIKRNGRHIISSPTNTLQKRQNTSILYLNIPSRGYFVRDLALRATKDIEKKQNICLEKAHEANTLLQYNFRIVRDCD